MMRRSAGSSIPETGRSSRTVDREAEQILRDRLDRHGQLVTAEGGVVGLAQPVRPRLVVGVGHALRLSARAGEESIDFVLLRAGRRALCGSRERALRVEHGVALSPEGRLRVDPARRASPRGRSTLAPSTCAERLPDPPVDASRLEQARLELVVVAAHLRPPLVPEPEQAEQALDDGVLA